MHAQLNIALRAAREGAVSLAQQFDRLDRVKEFTGAGQQRITSAHLEVQNAMLEQLRKTFPKHGYRSAVSDLDENPESDTVWLISPLLGTQNFLRGSPGFVLGLACQVDRHVSVAVLIDPLLNEEFTAVRGKGAKLGSHRMRVSSRLDLKDSLIAVEFENAQQKNAMPDLPQRLLNEGAGLRTTGNAVLDLLYVAAGRLDAGYTAKPEGPGLSAASLILQESGGLVSDTDGNPSLAGDFLVFGNPKCFKQLLKLTG